MLLALGIALIKGMAPGVATLVGGLVYMFANLLFTICVFRYHRAQELHKFVATFMFGEGFKLIFSASLFLVVVKHLSFSLLFTLTGFIGAIFSFWVAAFWCFVVRAEYARNQQIYSTSS